MRRSILAVALALLAGLIVGVPAYADLTVSSLEKELMCQCDCAMVLEPCRCGVAEQMRGLIGEMIDEGQTKGQILDYFVAEYGETVLSVPTKKGFNLTVWIVPFASILAGGTGLYFILRVWSSKGATSAEEAILQPRLSDDADEYQQKFEQELEQFRQEEDAR